VLTMPENRNFVSAESSTRAWHDLLKHDRSHPSVAFFSECNEVSELSMLVLLNPVIVTCRW
jgi:hypothetical protein